jgi:hypothetical protein
MKKQSSSLSSSSSSVSFDLSKTIVHEIEHIIDLTDDVKQAIWLTYDDYHNIKQQIVPIVEMMMKDIPLGDDDNTNDDITYRGLGKLYAFPPNMYFPAAFSIPVDLFADSSFLSYRL